MIVRNKYNRDVKQCREFSQDYFPENLRTNASGYMNLTQKSDRKPIESRALRPLFSPSEGISGVRRYKDTCGRMHGRRRGRAHVSEN